MPISSFFGLQTSLRGLLAQQRALDTTGHNVSNANTVGYSRQEAVMSAAPALVVQAGAIANGGGAQLGAGVDVQAYRRIRDTFLDLQYRAQAMTVGDKDTTAASLGQAELALSEPGDNGLASQLNKYWSAWADFANSPESPAARQALVDQGTTVATTLHTLDAQLATVGTQASDEFASITGTNGDVQGYATELAQLNGAISSAIQTGTTPNDLMDRRDLLLDQLSKLAQVSVSDTAGVPDRSTSTSATRPRRWSPARRSPGRRRSRTRAASSARCSRSATRAARSTPTAPTSTRSPRRSPTRSTRSTARRRSSPTPRAAPRRRSR